MFLRDVFVVKNPVRFAAATQVHPYRAVTVTGQIGMHRFGPRPQRRFRLLPEQRVARLHHQLVDLVQNLRRQQRDIAHQRSVLVPAMVVKPRMAEHLPNRPVAIGKVLQAVVVAPDALLERRQHEDPPQIHARAPKPPVHARKKMRVQQVEDLPAQRFVAVQVLVAPQHRRDVIPADRVNRNVLDGDFAKPNKRLLDCPRPRLCSAGTSDPSRRYRPSDRFRLNIAWNYTSGTNLRNPKPTTTC